MNKYVHIFVQYSIILTSNTYEITKKFWFCFVEKQTLIYLFEHR